jgi:DNA sulfur modification protein DndB
MATHRSQYIEVKQGRRKFLLTRIRAATLARISYTAVRGQSDEEGATQRVLNRSRISSIKEFALNGGDFPNAIVLNWVDTENPIGREEGEITFGIRSRCAQIIDGQHRVAGLAEAMRENVRLRYLQVPVAIYERLTTRESADIFLAINTEQKPVPKSLVFDLYGVASEELVDAAAVRARDIVLYLHETPDSPYEGQIKFPGQPTRKGGIALSTAIAAIKPLVEEKGVLEQIDIHELVIQRQIVANMFEALALRYGEEWFDKDNAFMWAAGFMAAMEFLRLRLVTYCNSRHSFEVKTIYEAIQLEKNDLITQDQIKGLGGTAAMSTVFASLVAAFVPEQTPGTKIRI